MSKVAVVVPIYNSEKYLKECLDSLISQEYENISIICIDDKSTDGSWDVLTHNYCDNKKVSGITLDTNGGASSARNVGIKIAEKLDCEFIHFFDSDDVALPNMISDKIKLFSYPDVAVVYSDYYEGEDVNSNNLHYNFRPIFDISDFIAEGYISCVSMARTKDIISVNGFDTALTYAEDWDLWFRILWNSIAIKVSKPMFIYRNNPESQTRNLDKTAYSLDLGILRAKIKFKTGDIKEEDVRVAYQEKANYAKAKTHG